jgi:glycosyltransferase involved in cell wall biosynthesis
MLGKIYGFRLFTNPLKNLSDSDLACRGPVTECTYLGLDKNMLQCHYSFNDRGELTGPSKLSTFSTTLEWISSWHWTVERVKENDYKDCTLQLYVYFGTSDIHPHSVEFIKKNFDNVIVPFKYMKNILDKHEIKCEYSDWYTIPYLCDNSMVIPKQRNPEEIIFFYNDINNPVTNVINMAKVFSKALKGTKHFLIIRSNHLDNLVKSPNIKCSSERVDITEIIGTYNICDYVVSFSRDTSVYRPILEGKHFNKPIIAHDQGSYAEMKDENWITLPSKEVPVVNYNDGKDTDENSFEFEKVFYGNWWEIDYEKAEEIIRKLVKT